MGAALAVVDRREDLRTMAHDALDTWLDQLDADRSKAPTLREISERFMATRLELLGACLETVIRQQYAAELQQTEAVCACGRRLRRRRLDAKEISTLHGRVTLHRPYFYCDACGQGFHPLDTKLGLAPEHHQYDIQERTTRLGAELPYGLSAEQFARLPGVPASPHFIHETLNAVGEAATLERVLPDANEVARRIETARAGARCRPVLVVACDGAHAPTRPPGGRTTKRGPGTWREGNELGAVVGGLLRMMPRTPEAEAAIRALSIYLEGQRERVGYDELRRRGLPRGSGGVESANKLICHVRLKRSGAWCVAAHVGLR